LAAGHLDDQRIGAFVRWIMFSRQPQGDIAHGRRAAQRLIGSLQEFFAIAFDEQHRDVNLLVSRLFIHLEPPLAGFAYGERRHGLLVARDAPRLNEEFRPTLL
jgi:hypothetical protein